MKPKLAFRRCAPNPDRNQTTGVNQKEQYIFYMVLVRAQQACFDLSPAGQRKGHARRQERPSPQNKKKKTPKKKKKKKKKTKKKKKMENDLTAMFNDFVSRGPAAIPRPRISPEPRPMPSSRRIGNHVPDHDRQLPDRPLHHS